MLSPHGRMSAFQAAQMYSCRTRTSTTSPCAACSTNARTSSRRSRGIPLSSKAPHRRGQLDQLGARRGAGRILLQGILQCDRRDGSQFPFQCLGNFGNVYAGTSRGKWACRSGNSSSRPTRTTCSTSFPHRAVPRSQGRGGEGDEQPIHGHIKSSNFERYAYDLVGRDAFRLKSLWTELDATGSSPWRERRFSGASRIPGSSRDRAPTPTASRPYRRV